MRILHVIASLAPRYGGPSVACPALCRELARRGHAVSIYTTDVDGRGRLQVPLGKPVIEQGVEIRHFPGWTFPPEYKPSLALWHGLREKIPAVDVVHIYSLYIFASTAAAHLCRKLKVPYLLHPHGTLDPYLLRRHAARKQIYSWLLERRNFQRAAAVLFNSNEEMRLAGEWLDQNVPPNNGEPGPIRAMVPVGVDEDWLRQATPAARERFRRKFPELIGRRIVLFFGRLSFKKGMEVLAQAFIEVAREHKDLQLVVAGPDTEGYGGKMREWLKAGGVMEGTTFTGILTGEERIAAMQEAEAFVLPSYSENFGQAVAEAMACGVPVVISNRVNLWPEVEAAGAGLVVDSDAQQTARALLTLLHNPALGRQMAECGRRLVAQRYSWKAVGDQMIELYQEIVRRHREKI
jgi:glycosyltransferase involved in cell wall biosynthesis